MTGLLWADTLIASWPTASLAVITGLVGTGFGLLAFACHLVPISIFTGSTGDRWSRVMRHSQD